MLTSLSQLAMKLTVPGVPDIYQGADLWEFSLVDPDNRRPVDFGLRQRLLGDLLQSSEGDSALRTHRLSQMLRNWRDGRIKLYLTQMLLGLRAADPELFRSGSYEPFKVHGASADHVVAFLRRHGDRQILVVAGRLFATLMRKSENVYDGAALWGETGVRTGTNQIREWTNVLTGERVQPMRKGRAGFIPCAQALRTLPVGIFQSSVR